MIELNELKKQLKELEKTFIRVNYPKTIVIELTNRCNINCIQCARSNITRKIGDMDISLFKKIIEDIAEHSPDSRVWLSNYGEPLMIGKEKISGMLSYAKNTGLTDTYMNTNAVLLDREISEVLIDGGLDHLLISVDGYSKKVYESIRVGADRDNVYRNILEFKKIKDKKNNGKPSLEVQFVLMKDNESEFEQYKSFWTELGIPIKLRSCITWGGNISGKSIIDDSLDRIVCGFTYSTCNITWDGVVTACGSDVNADFAAGNLNEQSVSEIWDYKERNFTNYHFNHRFDKLPEFCRDCVDWQYIGTVNYDEKGKRFKRSYEFLKSNSV